MGGFASFTVDFEPLPDGRLGFEFVNPRGPEDIDAGRRLRYDAWHPNSPTARASAVRRNRRAANRRRL